MDKTSVLIVEDDLLVSGLLTDVLTHLGCTIKGHATTVVEACDLIDSTHSDLVLLDINLHGRLTYDLAEKLRRSGRPVVFTTGHHWEEPIPLHLRGIPLLAKPYGVDDLKKLVAACRIRREALTGKASKLVRTADVNGGDGSFAGTVAIALAASTSTPAASRTRENGLAGIVAHRVEQELGERD